MSIFISNNSIAKQVAKRRWIRRLNLFSTPSTGWETVNGKRIFLDLTDWKGPSYHVLNWGLESYESESAKLLVRYFTKNPAGVFFDVGANIGIFSFKLATSFPELQIYAFEPEPLTYSCTKETLNQFPKARVFQMALSDQSGISTLFFDKSNHGGHSLNKDAIASEGSTCSGELKIEIETMDAFAAQNGISRMDFIKIDIQRHEEKMLAGAMGCIRKFRPLVLMECYLDDISSPDSKLLTPFIGQNYVAVLPENLQTFDIEPKQLASSLRQEGKAYRDLVFVPLEKVAFLQ